MTFLDTYIQQQRIRKALRYVPAGSTVLDIGCHKGELFKAMGADLGYGFGVDPALRKDITTENYILLKGTFPDALTQPVIPDCITMLAVLEHISPEEQTAIATHCYRLLNNNGKIIITVPSSKTDRLLNILTKLRFIKGMSLEEHYGFDIRMVAPLFTNAGFELVIHQPFQCGFNNLFIFQKKG